MDQCKGQVVPIRVVVDHREKASGVPEQLLALPNVTVEFRQLAFGDYWVDDQLIVERKTMRDFAESIIDSLPKTASNIRAVVN